MQRNLRFEIEENKKVKIKNIQFIGNYSYSDFRLKWKMKNVKQQKWFLFWRDSFDKKKMIEDQELISKSSIEIMDIGF